jgi:hypothetical protein
MRVILILTLACLLLSIPAESVFAKENPCVDGRKQAVWSDADEYADRRNVSLTNSSGLSSRIISFLVGRCAIIRTPTILFALIDSEKGERDEPYLDPPPHEGPWRTRIDLDEDPWEEQK